MKPHQKKYIELQYKKLNQYVEDVKTGTILTSKYVKKAVERYERDITGSKYELNEEALNRFFYFLSYIKINQGNKYVTFYPEGWQLFYLANLYGIYRKGTNNRKYRTSFLTMSRKQGKSTLATIQALYHLTYDNQIDGQNYIVSASREMAGVALSITKAIAANSPALNKRIEQLQYYLRYSTAKNKNILKVLPAQESKLNGLRVNFAILDEMHTLPDSKLYDMLKTGTVGVTNPLVSIITTRGYNTSYFQYEYEKYLKRVLDGDIKDDTVFALIYELENEEELKDPEKWIKSNPNLSNDKILTLEELKELYNSAKISLANLKAFVVLNLNYWYEKAADNFIEAAKLDAVFVDQVPDEIIEGEPCYLGGDFSSNRDISSISLVFPPSLNHSEYIIKNWNFKTINDIKRNQRDITTYIDSGDIIELESEVMDQEAIYEKILELSGRYNILNFGFDAANALQLIKKVKDNIGTPCTAVPQTAKALNYPLKFLEAIIVREEAVIDNMATKWMFKNVVLYVDSNGNYKAMKDKSKSSIDSASKKTGQF
jgi:phage terminase large subunit-like protein